MTDQLAKARDLARQLGYGDEFFAKGGELADWSATELVGMMEANALSKSGGPYIGPRGGKWADPQHTIPWESPTAPKPKNKRSHEPSDYEPPTDRMTDEAALQTLITMGDNLYANQEHGVEDAVGFSYHDCAVWHSVAAQADASNPASMHRLRALIGKYKRQITGGQPEHLDDFYRLGLQDALQKKSEHKGARILSRYTVDGTLLLPMAGRVGDFNAYREINKQFGVRVRKDANGAWQNYVPPPHSGKFDADGYTAKMAEIGVLVEDFPEAKPEIADAPPEHPSVQSAPQGGGSKMGADDALEAIRRRSIDNTVVVKYLTEGKHAGKVGFWSTFSLDFNAIMGNKSTDPRAITGIVEVDKDMGWVRLVDNVPLMEEALGKLKQHLPKHTFIVDANVDEWKAKLAKTASERQAPIPELVAKLTPEIKPYPFQNEAVRFFQANGGNGLLGDEMGLGKTLEALAYAAVEGKRTLVVCPKVVRGNWLREAKRFFPGHFDNVKELTTKALKKEGMPDLSQVKIATINYEILEKFMPAIEAAGFDLMIVDESHRVKNPKAQLTKNVQRIAKGVKHKILLSGTALKNKREELYTQLQLVRPGFVTKDELKSGMIGALHHKLSEIYLARKKRDVVTDMPEKVKQVVHLEVPNLPKLSKQGLTPEAIKDLVDEGLLDEFRAASLGGAGNVLAEDEGGEGGGLDEVTWMKHATAKAKAPVTAEFVEELLDSSDSLVLVFTDSKAAARSIVEKLGPVAVIHTGDQTDQAADDARAHFDPLRRKEGDSVRVLVSTTDKGIGFNAQLADKVVFNDLPWTPAGKDQAEDRAYRIGTKNTVNVYDVVAEGHPFDQSVLAILDRKRILAKKLMDGVKLTPEEKSWIDKPITAKDLLAMLKGTKVGPTVEQTQTVVSASGDTITAPVQKSLFTIRPDDELCKAGPYIGPKGGLWADPQHTQHWDPTQHAAPSGPKRAEDVLFNDVPLGLVPQKVAAMLALPDLEFARVTSRFDNYVKRLGGKVPASMARWSQILELARAGRPEAKTDDPKDIPPPLVPTELPTAVAVPPPALQPVDDAAKMADKAIAEQVAEAKAPKKRKGKSKKSLAKIESTGDHIWGSRYDLAQMERITSSEQLSGMAYDDAVKIVTKRHLVPAHSLQTLKALGMSPGTAHMTLALLSAIVAKPDDSPVARSKYVDDVHEVLAATLACKTLDNFSAMLSELANKQRSVKPRERVAEYKTREAVLAAAEQARKDDPKGSYYPINLYYGDFALERGVMRPLDSLGDRFSAFVNQRRGKAYESAYRDALTADGKWGSYSKPAQEIDGWAYLESRGAKAEQTAAEKAKSKAAWREREKAMNAAVGATAETERGWSGAKSVAEEVVRTGHTVTVKDADPQRVKSTFHLKEVDFGQEGYMTQADREYHTKELEGALHDFAEILGVAPEVLSLNGRLGIALGARGRGKHRAHYETGRFVINITKFAGGGTLAHEWGHALDNILAKVYNPKAAADAGGMFLSSAPQASYWPEDVRKAYAAVHEAMYAHPDIEKAKADRSAELAKLKGDHAKLTQEMNALTKRRQELHRKPTAEKLPLYVSMSERNIAGWESQRKDYEAKLANAKGTGSKLQYTSFIADLDRCLAEERPRLAAFQKGEGVRTEAETKEYEDLKGREELLRQDINRAAEKHDTLRRKIDPTRSLYAQSASIMGEYWSRPQEMFARAFESFVEDKLERMERKSTYLVDGTRNKYDVGKIGSASIEPYPQGEERERIFLAMAVFLKTLHSAGHLAKALTHMRFLVSEDTLQKADFDHTKEIADADGAMYERVKKLALRREYTDRDFDAGGVLYGWSTNEILDLLRDG